MENTLNQILTEDRFAHISEWGVLALLSRHARRRSLQSVFKGDLGAILHLVERIAEDGLGDPLLHASNQIVQNLRGKAEIRETSSTHGYAVRALEQFALCLNATWGESRAMVLQSSRESLHCIVMTEEVAAKASLVQIDDDIGALIQLANSTGESGLRTPDQLRRGGPPDMVSQDVFARYVKFNAERLIEIVPFVDHKMVAYFQRYPERLHDLNGRQFEELIAEIFAGFGFSVELTAPTGDYGRDIIAVNEKEGNKYLIECKRWKRNVGLAVVQRLHGVARGEGATKGIIATTARFTRQARCFLNAESVRWQLQGRDFEGIVEWLKRYDQLKMNRLLGRFGKVPT